MERRDEQDGRAAAGALLPGLLLVGVGAFFLMNNLHIVRVWDWIRYWPVILIAAGIVNLVDSTYAGGKVMGAILVGAGGLLLARSLGMISFHMKDLWPLVLIVMGLLLLYQRLQGDTQPGSGASTQATLREVAIFGGGKRKIVAQDFQGGSISAVFGGVELDLRKAGMAGMEVVIEVDAVFGGAEIRIPEEWSAVTQGTGIFGGFGDETTQPNPMQVPPPKRLIVRGSAVFGGVNVKN